ncbi:hypothetical protein SRB5_10860 [Streptomyces sp. RB5]|uniref:Lipoprotein n=1 Tax=Streptomyces smaragdinus TaxID=2585196 RepID=A0A7K0CCW5_9ACTN|nr:hypothetical protein [Streptomyces smaragdinus]MQY10972.1 hypothetical protein [Streptomyces smaragdinus]
MRIRTTVVGVALLAALTACGAGGDDEATATPSATAAESTPSAAALPSSKEAQDIADTLTAAGLKVSEPKVRNKESVLTDASIFTVTVTDQDTPASGETLINIFPDSEALDDWIDLTKSLGGISVTGDDWAISLPTAGKARDDSKRLAPRIAEALNGTVQQ